MQVDPRIPYEDAHAARDHRMRAGTGHERAPVTPGAPPVDPPHHGGPAAPVRPEFDRLRDVLQQGRDRQHQERRRRVRQAVATRLGLAADDDLELEVVDHGSGPRLVVRDRRTGAVLGELGPDLLQQLSDQGDLPPAGNLLDRSL